MEVQISDFLRDYNKPTNKGTCIACDKEVAWSREKLASQRRANCPNATAEEKERFRKSAPRTSIGSNIEGNSSMDTGDVDAAVLTTAKKEKIDAALAALRFRTWIPFRVVDSEAFRHFVALLNPTYADTMPKSRTVSGVLLDKEYNKAFEKLQDVLTNANGLVGAYLWRMDKLPWRSHREFPR